MLLAVLMHILRRVIAGLGALNRALAVLGALHPRPRRRVHVGGDGTGAAPASKVRSDVSAPGEGRQAVIIRVATFSAALFSMAPAVQASAVVPESGPGTGAEGRAESVVPRPKWILKAQASELPGTPRKARVLIDVQDNEMSLQDRRPGVRRHAQDAPRRRSVEEVLRETGADMIALQNVRAEEEHGMRPLSELAGALGMQFVFAESWAPGYGNAVLSRWPIKRWKVVRVADQFDLRNVLRATIEVPGPGEVNFHCTHLDNLDESWRMKQVESMLRSVDGPHILAGGLNALDATDYSADRWADIVQYYKEIGKPTPRAEVMEYLKGKQFIDAKDFAGECENLVVVAKGQGTCKYGTRVDYILASPNFPYKFVPGSYTVLSSKGTSDHHIVKVDIMISPTSSDSTESALPTASGATSAPLTHSAESTPVTSTGAPEVMPLPEETPSTDKVELVTTNMDPATHESAPAVDEEMVVAGTIAEQEATSMAHPFGSTTNPEQIIETCMPEVASDAMLQVNTLEDDTTATSANAICKEMSTYKGNKENCANTAATTSTDTSEHPISLSSLDLLCQLRGEEDGRRKTLDELLHRIEEAHKRELDATKLEIFQLKEKLELEQQKSEREIMSAKIKARKAEEARTNLVRRVAFLEGELQDAKDQIHEGKIKMSELGEAIEAAQKVHDRVMNKLNENEADAAKYAQSKVEELEALKISFAEWQRVKDEELRKLTEANTQLVGLISLTTWDLFGSESNLLTQTAVTQLIKIREFAPRMKVGVLKVFQILLPEKELPTSIAEFLRKLSKIPDYVTQWKQSAARAGASRALSLVKAHHPNLSIEVISAGKPEKHEDGRPFTAEDYSIVEKPLRGFATRLCSSVNVDKFFHPYQLDGTRTKATPTLGATNAPSTSTPTVPHEDGWTFTAEDYYDSCGKRPGASDSKCPAPEA
ncbi:unnamed protein product [Alopecurus aequalis]